MNAAAATSGFVLARDSLQAHEPQARLGRFRRRGYQRYRLALSYLDLALFWKRRWFIITCLLGAALMAMPTPAGLTQDGQIVLVMSLMATLLFITEPIPLPSVALMIVIGQVALLGLDSNTVARSLMTDSVLFIMGSLMLAVAVVKQKLDKRIALAIVRVTGTSVFWISFGITAVCGVLASFIGEHTVAAMMLPVGVTLISLTSQDAKKVKNLAAVLLLSISYGCAIAGIGTPSGGARNAIMIGYWRDFFYNPLDPESRRYLMDYVTWMLYAYPMFLVQLPLVTALLFWTFKPEYRDLSRAVARLRTQVIMDGPLGSAGWSAILLFCATIAGWVAFSETLGLGIVAIGGAVAFLIAGLVRWEDINGGVNWGVVLLYAAAISLGVEMKETGAAEWVATTFIGALAPFGADKGPGLYAAVAVLTTFVTNTMTAGAAVAVLGPVVLKTATVAGDDPLIIGFITAISSAFAYITAAAHPAFTIIYASGYLKAKDFFKSGVRMTAASLVLIMAAALVYWPLIAR
ncbi:MAG: DASS family sodium-coupled anion symporter [Rhizobiales bacterium]|nr:DASS family sodium-coupled anion symporter [Hyphomicrobiales bacterium]